MIASIAQRRSNCGVSSYAATFERELESRGIDFAAVTIRGAGRVLRATKTAGVIIHQEHSDGIRSFEWLWLPRILRICRSSNVPIVVIVHTIFDPKDMRKVPVVGAFVLLYQHILLRWLASSAQLVVLSRSGTKRLHSMQIPAAYVPHGIFPAEEAPRTRRSIAARLRIGVVGHPYMFKRYDLAAAAYAALPPEVRDRTEFWVLGGEASRDQPAFDRMLAALKDVPSDNIRITGSLDDAAFSEGLRGLDIVLLPYESRMQASGVVSHVVLSGCPAIVSGAPVFDDLVAVGGALRVADWKDGGSSALLRLIEQAPVREQLSKGLRRLAAAQAFPKTVGAILRLLQPSFSYADGGMNEY